MANVKHFRRRIVILIAAELAGLAGCMNTTGSQDMTNAEKRFRSFAELDMLARKVYSVQPGPRRSRPVPVLRQNQAVVAFMFCSQVLMPGPVQMRPPSIVAWFSPVTGERVAEARVSPSDFGQTDVADKYFPAWDFNLPRDMTYDAVTSLENHLYELYDALFPVWAIDISISDQSGLRSQAREFLKIFYQVSEPPLRPYYDTLGHDWFGWLRTLAQ